jgi:hypothetical protein
MCPGKQKGSEPGDIQSLPHWLRENSFFVHMLIGHTNRCYRAAKAVPRRPLAGRRTPGEGGFFFHLRIYSLWTQMLGERGATEEMNRALVVSRIILPGALSKDKNRD